MAKTSKSASVSTIAKPKVKRRNIHSKKKQSKNKNSKSYKKPYASQGR